MALVLESNGDIKMLKNVLVVATFTTASFFATSSFAEETADTLKAAIDAAKTSQAAAAAVGGEWRDVGKFLKKAEELGAAGEFDKAVKLAKKADTQSQLGKAQMEGQTNLDFPAYFTK